MDHRIATASTADRLDRALDRVLAGAPASVDPELHRLLVTGERVAADLRPVPAGDRFTDRVRSRLTHPGRIARLADAVADLPWRRRPSWLVLTGALSTAAVGVGVTAIAVWRGTHRAGHR